MNLSELAKIGGIERTGENRCRQFAGLAATMGLFGGSTGLGQCVRLCCCNGSVHCIGRPVVLWCWFTVFATTWWFNVAFVKLGVRRKNFVRCNFKTRVKKGFVM